MNIVIRGGRVVDPLQSIDRAADVYVSDGKVASVGDAPSRWQTDRVIDAHG
jgi:dihydroorotase